LREVVDSGTQGKKKKKKRKDRFSAHQLENGRGKENAFWRKGGQTRSQMK